MNYIREISMVYSKKWKAKNLDVFNIKWCFKSFTRKKSVGDRKNMCSLPLQKWWLTFRTICSIIILRDKFWYMCCNCDQGERYPVGAPTDDNHNDSRLFIAPLEKISTAYYYYVQQTNIMRYYYGFT